MMLSIIGSRKTPFDFRLFDDLFHGSKVATVYLKILHDRGLIKVADMGTYGRNARARTYVPAYKAGHRQNRKTP